MVSDEGKNKLECFCPWQVSFGYSATVYWFGAGLTRKCYNCLKKACNGETLYLILEQVVDEENNVD